MPVGMTLQQLYSQPAYHADANSGVSAAPVASTSSSSSVAGSSSISSASSKRPPSINTSLLSEKDYSPRTHDSGAYPPTPTQEQRAYQDHHAAMQHQQQQQQHQYPSPYGQLPPPHAYAQYHAKPQQGSAAHGDDYGIADPLPFEYMGLRKFPESNKDQVVDHRYTSNMNNGGQYPGNYSAHSPHPSVYESQHVHPPKSVEDRAYHQSYAQHHTSDRTAGAYQSGADGASHFPHASHSSMPPHLYAAATASASAHSGAMSSMQHTMPAHHSFPPLLDASQQHSKKESSPTSDYNNSSSVEYPTGPSSGPGGASQEAVIKVKTPLKTKYWRNGRRNLQCFPSCKVFGDYSSIKIEDLKQHDFMWGKCRGSLITEVSLNSSVSFDDILIMGRVHSMENVPVAFEEAVIRECMLGRMVEPEVMDAMKDQWITGERLPDFVQQGGNMACYEFKPKVWKYTEDMTQGKCKRRNVKYYVQFEAFVLVMSGERRYYACIGSGMSTAFEVGSSRVLARQKRKAATGLDANPLYSKQGGPSIGSPTDIGAAGQMPPHSMMAPHGMMPPPHGMHPQMYPGNNYPHAPPGYPQSRGLAPTMPHPSMMGQMHHPEMGGPPPYYHQGPPPLQSQSHMHSQPQLPPQLQPIQASGPAPSTGQKRKAPGSAAPRASKPKKTKEVTAM